MPTAEAQSPCHLSVASFITGQLVNPEIPIALGDAQVFWASMPETAIHENDKMLLAEREIRSAKERDVSPPARDAGDAQQLRQGELSLLVAAPTNARHHLRAFGLGENVGHESRSSLLDGRRQFDQAAQRFYSKPLTSAKLLGPQLLPGFFRVKINRVASSGSHPSLARESLQFADGS